MAIIDLGGLALTDIHDSQAGWFQDLFHIYEIIKEIHARVRKFCSGNEMRTSGRRTDGRTYGRAIHVGSTSFAVPD